jgi:hypothetical protein
MDNLQNELHYKNALLRIMELMKMQPNNNNGKGFCIEWRVLLSCFPLPAEKKKYYATSPFLGQGDVAGKKNASVLVPEFQSNKKNQKTNLDRETIILKKISKMYTKFHFRSAEEINSDMLKAIKAAFKSKPVTITVEEDHDETAFLLSNPKNREKLLKSIAQHKTGELVDITGNAVEL